MVVSILKKLSFRFHLGFKMIRKIPYWKERTIHFFKSYYTHSQVLGGRRSWIWDNYEAAVKDEELGSWKGHYIGP